MTVQFLAAPQSLFEFGILSHEKILDASSSVLTNMEDVFLFFVAWADYCCSEGKCQTWQSRYSFDNYCSNNNANVNWLNTFLLLLLYSHLEIKTIIFNFITHVLSSHNNCVYSATYECPSSTGHNLATPAQTVLLAWQVQIIGTVLNNYLILKENFDLSILVTHCPSPHYISSIPCYETYVNKSASTGWKSLNYF